MSNTCYLLLASGMECHSQLLGSLVNNSVLRISRPGSKTRLFKLHLATPCPCDLHVEYYYVQRGCSTSVHFINSVFKLVV